MPRNPHKENCPYTHEPNEVTKKALEQVKKRKGLKNTNSLQDILDVIEK